MSETPSELKRLRKEIGSTQAQMAQAMRLDLRTYQRSEKHGCKPVYVLAARWVHHEAIMATRT